MLSRGLASTAFAAAVGGMAIGFASADAAEIAPHRALYAMTLGNSHNDSGVVDAHGTMAYEWGETCDGWTIEQRYRLKMRYAESQDVEIVSNFVTWEAKNGLRYRFNQKQTRNGDVEEEIRGEARLDGPGQGTACGAEPVDQPSANDERTCERGIAEGAVRRLRW